MQAAQYDIAIEQGATYIRMFVWRNDDGPVNLEGYTARMQIRRNPSAEDVLFSATTENTLLSINAAEGKVTLVVPATTTETFDWRNARYDLELESSGGVVYRLVQGSVTVSKEITRG
jgi:hypothetical protein